MALTLVIGNKNYSSWSLRPWLAMKMAAVEFGDVRIALDRPDTRSRILQYASTSTRFTRPTACGRPTGAAAPRRAA